MVRKYYFSEKQLKIIDRHAMRAGNRTPINEVKCDDGKFRRFTSQYLASDQGPTFDDLIVVHKGDNATVRYNGFETIND